MLELLHFFQDASADSSNSGDKGTTPSSSADTDLHLVLVLNQLSKSLLENLDLLRFFFMADEEVHSKSCTDGQFMIFSLLVTFLHRSGHTGQLARDALLHCMSLSKKNENVGNYIADMSNFCPVCDVRNVEACSVANKRCIFQVLATGLSGLYSALPRQLPAAFEQDDPEFMRISDILLSQKSLPELQHFVTSIQFCDAVVQIAHDKVRKQLLNLIIAGFLVPVMGPAITQVSLDWFVERISSVYTFAHFFHWLN